MEFQEKYKVNIALFDATGATTEKVSDYFDMKGYRRADFILEGAVRPTTGGPSTNLQIFTLRLLQASNSTGGGSSAISSATAVVGKRAATGVSATDNLREGWIRFSTFHGSAADYTLNVGTAAFLSASAAAAMAFAAQASDNASIASEGFVTLFNSTVNNTSTALTENWVASTWAGAAMVRISPKDHESTFTLRLGTTGASEISVGGVFTAHIGMETQFMGDGKRYIAIGAKSSADPCPFTITLLREKIDAPAVQEWSYSKSINQSTAK